MTHYTPMHAPMIIVQQPIRCPSCKNIENKKVVCANCGYEYKNTKEDALIGLGLLALFLIPLIGGFIAKNQQYGDFFDGYVNWFLVCLGAGVALALIVSIVSALTSDK